MVAVVGIAGVIVAWAWLVRRLWRACVVLTSTAAGTGTVAVQGWFTDYRIPVSQIMEVTARPRYGPLIRTVDGREIGFIALSPPWPTARACDPEREMIETIASAARAAATAQQEEVAALLLANAPLRVRREQRRILRRSGLFLGLMVVGLIVRGGWPLAVAGGFLFLLEMGLLYLERAEKSGESKH